MTPDPQHNRLDDLDAAAPPKRSHKRRRTDHILAGPAPHWAYCSICGATLDPPHGTEWVSIKLFLKLSAEFQKEHLHPTDEPTPPTTDRLADVRVNAPLLAAVLDESVTPIILTVAEREWLDATLTAVMRLARLWDDRTDNDIANATLNKVRRA